MASESVRVAGDTPHATLDEQRGEDTPQPLYDRASIFSKMFVSWISPVLATGSKRPLQFEDMPALGCAFGAAGLRARLLAAWATHSADKKHALLRALLSAFGREYYMAAALKILADVCMLLSPLALAAMLEDLKRAPEQRDIVRAAALCAILYGLQQANPVFVNAYFLLSQSAGVRARTACAALVHDKALRASARARVEHTHGRVVNMAGTDATRIEMAASMALYLVSGPFQLVVIVVLLYRMLGWASLVGVGLLVVLVPLQSATVRRMGAARAAASAATDRRVRMMQELVAGVRVVKLYGWEGPFWAKLEALREAELGHVRRTTLLRVGSVLLSMAGTVMCAVVSFVVYRCVLGLPLTAGVVFPALSLFSLLRLPLMLLPMVVNLSVDGYVALGRIERFLRAPELSFGAVRDADAPAGVSVRNGTFAFDAHEEGSASPAAASSPERDRIALHDVNMCVPRGSLAAVVGPVGSGKSTLLAAIVGELVPVCERGLAHSPRAEALEKGRECAASDAGDAGAQVVVAGDIALCPQQAWIANASIRDNVLFGAPYDAERYARVLDACALRRDLASLPAGDATLVGEKGVSLSGGQRQRLSLARAAYSAAPIVLLDDPLSAVDAHVGAHLFEECISGLMAGRTRILVTHNHGVLSRCDSVLVMHGGRIAEQGTFSALAALPGGRLSAMLRASGTATASLGPGDSPHGAPAGSASKQQAVASDQGHAAARQTDEERAVGSISVAVLGHYFAAAGGAVALLWVLATLGLHNVLRVATDYAVAQWAGASRALPFLPPDAASHAGAYASAYASLAAAQVISAAANAAVFALACLRASRKMHADAAFAVLHAQVPAFFDVSPAGRVLSRFSRDVDVLDNTLFEALRMLCQTVAMTAATFAALVAVLSTGMAVGLAVVVVLFYRAQGFYRASAREVRRLEGTCRAPVLARLSETLTGLPSVRAYGLQASFSARFCSLLDAYNRVAVVQVGLQRWLAVRLESLGALVVLSAAVCVYAFQLSAEGAGFALTYAMGVTGVMAWAVRQLAEAEAQIVSSERLHHYATGLPQEAPQHVLAADPPRDAWPSAGAIRVRNLRMAYRAGLPDVLCGVSLSIAPGERVGVVGRTGAGKSSLMLALFRIVEPQRMAGGADRTLSPGEHAAVKAAGAESLDGADEAIVEIDGVDIQSIGLHCVRSRLSIIPQDPVVFADSVRWNLDPYGTHADKELWDALEQAHLRQTVVSLSTTDEATGAVHTGLDAVLSEGGENLSVGQRQLLCLARAILRRSRILVLDEATASIDRATDTLIQSTIRGPAFANCTVLTIAHRIETVIDYDRVLVLDAGRVLEFDTPEALLAVPGGAFSSLVRESRSRDSAPRSP